MPLSSGVVIRNCHLELLLSWSVDVPPGHRFDHSNFIFCTHIYANMPLVYTHGNFVSKWQPFFLFITIASAANQVDR